MGDIVLKLESWSITETLKGHCQCYEAQADLMSGPVLRKKVLGACSWPDAKCIREKNPWILIYFQI